MLEHGGRIAAATKRYGIAEDDWLDLSTGINPHGWAVPTVPARAWQRLPEADDDLHSAAAAYYGNPLLLPVAGSQAAIQALPLLRQPGRVGVLSPGYNEHLHAWQRAGHQVQSLAFESMDSASTQLDVVVLCNPNNPTGSVIAPETLGLWRERLASRGGWLVVDEAFIDATPTTSVTLASGQPGLIVLRSLGKFFGLAGARVGFVCAWPELLTTLNDALGPWTVSGPSRWAAATALRDFTWHAATRATLANDSARLGKLLTEHGLSPTGSTMLFHWITTHRAKIIHESLAQNGILSRYFAEPESLRFGLPGKEHEWHRLSEALRRL